MELSAYLVVAAVAFVIFGYTAVQSKKSALKRMHRKIEEQWGVFSEREYEAKEYDKISDYYRKIIRKEGISSYIDDITWNDLDMDTMFMAINNTFSSAGEECLYKILRITGTDEDVLKERDRLAEYFSSHKENREKLQEIFYTMGRTKNISLTEFMGRLNELKEKGNAVHYILDALFLASVCSLFIEPVIGIVALLIMVCVNVFVYYNRKSEIESYFVCFKYLVFMHEAAEQIVKEDYPELSIYTKRLKEKCRLLMPVRKGAFLLASTNVNGSISEIIMEYVRMITHVDLIKFNSMLKYTKKYEEEIEELFETLGNIEAMIAVASFRECLSYYTKPVFREESSICFEDIYHPLIEAPVANSMKEEKCVLVTGSNASGKSTFLKTVALNAIFAQTIDTCTARSYHTAFYHIYTSMALRDNLKGQESYYIVEIKSLKRIIDSVKAGNKVICFVDEVLRGTNTVERIAASTYILKGLADSGAMCFAATHDVELTNILEHIYSNYHFQEEVRDDDVLFNYKLFDGRAVTRNAIKLLKVMGYDGDIIKNAQAAAEHFIHTGMWENAVE